MTDSTEKKLADFLDVLGLDEPPMGIYFTDQEPESGTSPKPGDRPTLEKEKQNAVDWQAVNKRRCSEDGTARRENFSRPMS